MTYVCILYAYHSGLAILHDERHDRQTGAIHGNARARLDRLGQRTLYPRQHNTALVPTYLVQKQGEPPKPVVILDADHRAKPLDDPCEHAEQAMVSAESAN